MTEITFKLSTDEIQRAIDDIKAYKADLVKKCATFVEELAYAGIVVAEHDQGEFSKYLTFGKRLQANKHGAVAIMYGVSPSVWQFWIGSDGLVKAAEIMPILMAEFGSGANASDAANLQNEEIATKLGLGRGTFPGQTHAFEDEWYWKDLKGEWHSSQGVTPTMPMFKALVAMKSQILQTAKKVFRT